jgi:hypothetical protein
LQAHLTDGLALKESERSRLKAHLQVLLSESPTLRSLKARVERTKPEHRGAIAQLVMRVAAADGSISPKEIQLLEKIYLLLELDPQTLYSDIHGFSTAAKPALLSHDPVTVRQASATTGHSIPLRPKRGEKAAFALDMAMVQSKLVESQEISNLLAEIFVNEGEALSSKTADQSASSKSQSAQKQKRSRKPAPSVAREIAGLDAPHSALLMALTQQQVWSREQLEPIAAQYDLMLDGALEVINEAAFDHSDEPVTEGHDSIEVNIEVLREMLA